MNKQKTVGGFLLLLLSLIFIGIFIFRDDKKISVAEANLQSSDPLTQGVIVEPNTNFSTSEIDEVLSEVSGIGIVLTVTASPPSKPELLNPSINSFVSDRVKLERQAAKSPIALTEIGDNGGTRGDSAATTTQNNHGDYQTRQNNALIALENHLTTAPPNSDDGRSNTTTNDNNAEFRRRVSDRQSKVGIFYPPVGKKIIHEGTILPAVLETAINSQLPGKVRAKITRHVFDSLTAKSIAIPRGSLLLGEYNSAVVEGQGRLYLIFNRIILPDGRSANLEAPSTDATGASGLTADVDTRFWEKFGSSLIIGGAGLLVDDLRTTSGDGSGNTVAGVAAKILADTANDIRQQRQYSPILTIGAGTRIHLFTNKDIVLN